MFLASNSKLLSNYINRFVVYHHMQQIRVKSSFRYRKTDDFDDDGPGHYRTRKVEVKEGYLHFYKSRGQHILTNTRVIDSIVQRSDIKSTDTVLEIGPGTGNLTLKLLEVAKNVIAVEIDKRMVEILTNRVKDCGLEDKLTVICEDALNTEFPKFDLLVANIPYGISSPLLAKLMFGESSFRSATLLLQKEFARRLLAKPGDSEYNRLAANVKLVADVEFVMDVSKRDFLPPPRIDSSVVKIHPKDNIPDVNLDEWCSFTRTCFNNKNKTLGATFKQKRKVIELLKLSEITSSKDCVEFDYLDCNDDHNDDEDEGIGSEGDTIFRDKIVGILKSGGFENKRPCKMSNEELLSLLSLFNEAGIRFHNKQDQGVPKL